VNLVAIHEGFGLLLDDILEDIVMLVPTGAYQLGKSSLRC
jgi:hypothetical protein